MANKLISVEILSNDQVPQTVHEPSVREDDLFPEDFVPKSQPSHQRERELWRGKTQISWLQVKHTRSSWLCNHDRALIATPGQKVLINSMEDDSDIMGREPEEEFERYQELDGVIQAAFPGDRWTYGEEEMTRREVLKEIERSVEGQVAVKELADGENLDVPLYPVIPGWEPNHFERCRKLFDVFETRSCAFDGTQYKSQPLLIQHLEDLVDVLGANRIYLNGRISESCLRDVPNEVVAFSGKESLRREIERPDGSYSHELLEDGIRRRVAALHNRQMKFSDNWAQISQKT